MDIVLEPLGTEEACNATPKTFGNNQLIRVVNSSTGLRLLTVKDVHSVITITVNTDANATTLHTLTSGDSYRAKVGHFLVNSSNTGVVNTDVLVEITQVINATSFVVNTDILVANGTANVSIASLVANVTLLGNSEVVVSKNRSSTLHSNNNTDVLAIPVAWRE